MKLMTILSLLIFSTSIFAKTTLKVGVLAPEGTSWANNMKKMGKEIEKATNDEVKIKFYFGGTQGDEPDVLKKIRIGQLQGGVFTGKTLGEIYGDVRVVEIPFTFGADRGKAMSTVKKLAPYFDKEFSKHNFKNLGFFEIGLVYFVSQQEPKDLESLKGLKIWSWEGDQLVSSMVEALHLVSVPLPLPDVLSSLATGIVQAAYAPPLGIIALQWNTKIKYLLDFPLAFSTGAFLVDNKAWDKIPAATQKIVQDLATQYIEEVNKSNAKDNEDALASMKAQGIQFVKFPKTDNDKSIALRSGIVKKLTGKLFTPASLDQLSKAMK